MPHRATTDTRTTWTPAKASCCAGRTATDRATPHQAATVRSPAPAAKSRTASWCERAAHGRTGRRTPPPPTPNGSWPRRTRTSGRRSGCSSVQSTTSRGSTFSTVLRPHAWEAGLSVPEPVGGVTASSLKAWVSLRQRRLVEGSEGQARQGELKHPKKDAQFVSLRVRAGDRDGNIVDQTVDQGVRPEVDDRSQTLRKA